MSRRGGWLGEQFFRRQAKSPPGVFALTLAWPHAHTPDDLSADRRFMQGKKAAGHHFSKRCCPNATRLDRRSTYGFTFRHEGRRHAHLAARAGSTRHGTAFAPGAQASTMPRRLYAERRLLRPAVAQRAAVDRKAWIGTTKPADSEKSLPALSIPATRVSDLLRSGQMSA